jgi:hypothetical protein
MSRLFTVNFRFKEAQYTALVSLQDKGYDLSFVIRYLNTEVDAILPERKAVFSLNNGIESPKNLSHKLAEEFVVHTSHAITHYLDHHVIQDQ